MEGLDESCCAEWYQEAAEGSGGGRPLWSCRVLRGCAPEAMLSAPSDIGFHPTLCFLLLQLRRKCGRFLRSNTTAEHFSCCCGVLNSGKTEPGVLTPFL